MAFREVRKSVTLFIQQLVTASYVPGTILSSRLSQQARWIKISAFTGRRLYLRRKSYYINKQTNIHVKWWQCFGGKIALIQKAVSLGPGGQRAGFPMWCSQRGPLCDGAREPKPESSRLFMSTLGISIPVDRTTGKGLSLWGDQSERKPHRHLEGQFGSKRTHNCETVASRSSRKILILALFTSKLPTRSSQSKSI